jgi:hypothetical protein
MVGEIEDSWQAIRIAFPTSFFCIFATRILKQKDRDEDP